MPFRSKQQSRYMHKFHPDIAEKWKKEQKAKTGSRKLPKGTPKRVKKTKKGYTTYKRKLKSGKVITVKRKSKAKRGKKK